MGSNRSQQNNKLKLDKLWPQILLKVNSHVEVRTDLILERLSVNVGDANFAQLRRLGDERDDLRRAPTLAVEDGQKVGLALPDVDPRRHVNVNVGVV